MVVVQRAVLLQRRRLQGKSKLATLLGNDIYDRIADKTVIDFGCGDGDDAIELAQKGAERVIGIDICDEVLETARKKAAESEAGCKCAFVRSTEERADVLISLDSFEPFAEPARILQQMSSLLQPSGEVLASFGPTWFHPLGGHLFSVFP